MARVVIDSSNAESAGFTKYEGEVPPAGLYRVRLSYGKYGKASSGNMMLTVVLELDTDKDGKKQFNGYSVWHNLVQLPQTLWRTKEFLQAINQPTKLSLDFDEDSGKVTKIGGARMNKVWLLAKLKDDMYNGERKLSVDSLSALPNQPDVEDEDIDEDDIDDEVVDAVLVGDNEPPF